jgi:tetratricopeptide (TPR) repeat protein
MYRFAVASIIVALWTGVPPAQSAEIDHARQYRACMALAQRAPEEAFESAIAWRGLGGGGAADHCAAAALVGLAIYDEAARRFEQLAETVRADKRFKADLLGHAAQAWLLAKNATRAVTLLDAALGVLPSDVDLLIDRSAALAATGAYSAAITDLDRAIALDPGRPDAFVFRASAQRFLDQTEHATADVKRALELDPAHPEGLLERGILRRLAGEADSARRDWLAVIDIVPGSPTAKAARANLQKMDDPDR